MTALRSNLSEIRSGLRSLLASIAERCSRATDVSSDCAFYTPSTAFLVLQLRDELRREFQAVKPEIVGRAHSGLQGLHTTSGRTARITRSRSVVLLSPSPERFNNAGTMLLQPGYRRQQQQSRARDPTTMKVNATATQMMMFFTVSTRYVQIRNPPTMHADAASVGPSSSMKNDVHSQRTRKTSTEIPGKCAP